MKKPDKSQVAAAAATGCPDATFSKQYPTITQFLSDVAWDDGTKREPSSLGVTVRDGLVQLAMNDKDAKQSMYTSAGSLTEALKLMEKALAGGLDAWRPWNAGKKR